MHFGKITNNARNAANEANKRYIQVPIRSHELEMDKVVSVQADEPGGCLKQFLEGLFPD